MSVCAAMMPLTAFFFSSRFKQPCLHLKRLGQPKECFLACLSLQLERKKVAAPRFWLMRRSWHQSHLSILHLNFDPQQFKQQAHHHHHHGQRRKSCAIHLCTDVMTDPKNMQYQKRKSLLFFYFYAFCQPPKNQKSISNLNFGASTIQKVLRYLKSQDIPRGFKML